MISRYIHWQLRSKVALGWSVIAFLLIIGLSVGLKNLSLASDYKIFFDRDDPDLLLLESMQQDYSETENVFVMIEPKTGSVFTKENIEVIFSLTNDLWQVPYVSRVDSITNFPSSFARDDDIQIEEFIYDESDITDNRVTEMSDLALLELDLVNKLITADGKVSAINLTIRMPEAGIKEATLDISKQVGQLLQEYKRDNPNIEFSVSGIVTMNAAFINAAKKDFITLIPAMMLLVLFAAGIILGSVKAAMIVFITLLLSFTGALGLAGWLGITLSAPSISAPIIMFTVIVASSIHILVYVKRRQFDGISPECAVIDSYRHNAAPIFLSHITTVIGFLSMNLSDSPPFRDLGNIVAFGVLLSLLQIFSTLPMLLKTMRFSSKRRADVLLRNFSSFISEFVIARRVFIMVFMGLFAIFATIFASKSNLNDDLVKYFDESVKFRADATNIDHYFSGLYNIDYSIESGLERGIFDYEFLSFADAFEEWLSHQSYVLTTSSPIHRIKDLNKLIHSGDVGSYRLPEDKSAAAQNFLLYEMSLPFGRETTNYITLHKDSLKVTARFKNMGSQEVLEIESHINAWLQKHQPENIVVTYTSPALIFSHIGSRATVSLLEGAIIALLIISLALLLVFRSILVGIVTLIPNLLPIAAAFGVWQLLGGEISMGLAGVAAMTIGIVVDDTVHFVYQYVASVRNGKSPDDAVRHTFDRTMPAILISSILLAIGFMLLSTSSFEKNSDLGVLTSITIMLALLFDLLLLPAIAMTVFKDRRAISKKNLNASDLFNDGVKENVRTTI